MATTHTFSLVFGQLLKRLKLEHGSMLDYTSGALPVAFPQPPWSSWTPFQPPGLPYRAVLPNDLTYEPPLYMRPRWWQECSTISRVGQSTVPNVAPNHPDVQRVLSEVFPAGSYTVDPNGITIRFTQVVEEDGQIKFVNNRDIVSFALQLGYVELTKRPWHVMSYAEFVASESEATQHDQGEINLLLNEFQPGEHRWIEVKLSGLFQLIDISIVEQYLPTPIVIET